MKFSLYFLTRSFSLNTLGATKLQQWPSHQRLNVGHPDDFGQWLAGLVDGDGTFWFNQTKKGSWDFTFKVVQSNYNLKLLTYLKKKLKCGSVTSAGKHLSQYRIRHPEILKTFVLPLFENKLLTRSKAWDYLCMKEALEIYCNPALCLTIRNKLLQEVLAKKKLMPETFVLSHPKNPNYPPVGWILGFTEAEGSLYLTQKGPHRLVHGFGWIQKEKRLLESLKSRFHLKSQVKLHVSGKYWILESTSSKGVDTVIPFFEKKLKGMKAVEASKWIRSYRKHKGNFEKLSLLQSSLRESKKFKE
jgi:hypothetical protein